MPKPLQVAVKRGFGFTVSRPLSNREYEIVSRVASSGKISIPTALRGLNVLVDKYTADFYDNETKKIVNESQIQRSRIASMEKEVEDLRSTGYHEALTPFFLCTYGNRSERQPQLPFSIDLGLLAHTKFSKKTIIGLTNGIKGNLSEVTSLVDDLSKRFVSFLTQL